MVELSDGLAIDQHRRALVAQAGAGRGGDADQPVFRHLAGLDPQLAAQGIEQLGVAEHAVGDVVGEQHPVAAHRAGVEKTVEAGDALDPGAGDVEPRRDAGQDRGRQPAGDVLGVDEDLQQAGRIVPVSLQDAVEGGEFV